MGCVVTELGIAAAGLAVLIIGVFAAATLLSIEWEARRGKTRADELMDLNKENDQ